MRIIVAGTGRLGSSVMEPLIHSHHDVVGLLQNGRKIKGLMRTAARWEAHLYAKTDQPIRFALEHKIPVLWLEGFSEKALAPIRRQEPNLIITCGFSIIFKKSLLDLPSIGCLNIHSSLLPKHRGPMPFGYVVMLGEETSGVTYHVMEEGIDTGAIVDQHPYPVGKHDTTLTVYHKACDVARRSVLQVVDRIEQHGLVGTPQNEDEATYDEKLEDEDTRIDWNRSAFELDCLVRAGVPYQNAWFPYKGHQRVYITRATWNGAPAGTRPGEILALRPHLNVATGSGVLTIRRAHTKFLWPKAWPSLTSRPRVGHYLDSP